MISPSCRLRYVHLTFVVMLGQFLTPFLTEELLLTSPRIEGDLVADRNQAWDYKFSRNLCAPICSRSYIMIGLEQFVMETLVRKL